MSNLKVQLLDTLQVLNLVIIFYEQVQGVLLYTLGVGRWYVAGRVVTRADK